MFHVDWQVIHMPAVAGPLVYSTLTRHPLGHRSATISYLGPLLAIVVGIAHAALAPVIIVGGVKPNLVLVAVVLVTILGGFLPGITWAFVAGLTANLLVGDALGSVPLVLLVVAAIVAGGGRLVGRAVWIYPVLAAFIGSVVADIGSIALATLLTDVPPAVLPTDLVIGAAFLNAAICAVLLYPARFVASRHAIDESTAW
ncbi:hypothetical protein BH23CHL9_BH23CHL9_08960 [soil metagenome]